MGIARWRVAKLSLGRAGLKFESFRQTVASCHRVATRPASKTVAVRSLDLRRPKHARRSDKIDGVDGESLKILRDRPVFIVSRYAEEKLCTLYKPWNVRSLLTAGSRWYYSGQKKRTIVEIRGEKNAVPRVISCSIRRDQRRAKVADSRGSDSPCADRAWSSMISHVEQRSSRRESRRWLFFLSTVVFFVSAACDRLGQGRFENAVSCSEESFFCFLRQCGVQAVDLRSSTCTAEHVSDKTTATVQIESSLLSGSFYHPPPPCCFFFCLIHLPVLIFVGEEQEEVWFDNSHCSRSNIGLARWAWSQPTAPLRAGRVCDSLLTVLLDLRLFATRQYWHSLPFSGPPSRGRPLRWCSSKSPLNHASA